MSRIEVLRIGLAALAVGVVAATGCSRGHADGDSHEAGIVREPAPRLLPSEMEVAVVEVDAVPGVDPDVVRTSLEEAEAGLLACLEPDGSTGVLALRMGLTREGSVETIAQRASTTYGGEESRDCMERLLGSMRFPSRRGGTELDVTLEVRPRRSGG